jgi:predicted DNA-binding transcriptional regulator YafY
MNFAGVSERTIRRDVARGRLRVARVNGRQLVVRRVDAVRYWRLRSPNARGGLVSAREFAAAIKASLRTVRTMIERGQLRTKRTKLGRVYIDPSKWFSQTDVDAARLFWADRCATQSDRERFGLAPNAEYLTVRQTAKLTSQSVRTVHEDLRQKVLQGLGQELGQIFKPSARIIRIPIATVAAYVDLVQKSRTATRCKSAHPVDLRPAT